jgi:putative ABC transport system permease protein
VLQPFLQTVRLGISSLLLHKLRSGLAVLGILIGIAAVISLVAMGEGVSYQAQQQIKDLGANNVIVRSVKPVQQSSNASSRSFFLEYGLLRDDYKRIITNLPPSILDNAVPMREIRKEVRCNDRTMDARIVGCTPAYSTLNHLTVDRGRFLNETDSEPPQNVCVLAGTTAQTLFPLENPIGRAIQIDRDFYVVCGTTRERTPTAAIGGSLASQDYNMDVYIPLTTLRARIGDMVSTSRSGSREGEIVQLSQITIGLKNIDAVEETSSIISSLLQRYHPNKDFDVVVPKELLRQAELLRMMFNVLLI